MKRCTRCHREKPLEKFIIDQRYRLGVTGWCRECKLDRGKERAAEIRAMPKRIPREKRCETCERVKPSGDFSQAMDKLDGLSSRCKECRRRCEEATRRTSLGPKRNHLWGNYGMTLDDAKAMYDAQQGCCAICRLPLASRPSIDHNHASGHVRGMLCFRCNNYLCGLEDAQFVANATAYLKYHAENPGPFTIRPRVQQQRNKRLRFTLQ